MKLFKGIFVVVGLTLALLSVAATSASSGTTTAIQIAATIIVVAPFVITLASKYIPLDGKIMAWVVLGLSLGGSVVAAVVSGLVHATDFSTVPGILLATPIIFGFTQLIFQTLKDSSVFGKYLK